MIQFFAFLLFMIGLFASVGAMRKWTKELIATAGIVLALFTLRQLETIFIFPLSNSQQHRFLWQAGILIGIGFFAYQTPPDFLKRQRTREIHRDGPQDSLLGAFVGGLNGYLLIGSLWWYMDNLEYPLSPYIVPVAPESTNAGWMDMLIPLNYLLGGDGTVLSLLMIVLFLFIIMVVV
ncbi:MAG: hypothetical protein JXQ72_16580 [Anaerolineae bacterium]|nr:hypothetical protein [Anaerolineae bacterium]